MGKPLVVQPLAPTAFPRSRPQRVPAGKLAGIRYEGRQDLLLLEVRQHRGCGHALDDGGASRHLVPAGARRPCAALHRQRRQRQRLPWAEGDAAVRAEAEAARVVGCRPEQVLVASTGVIGERLPVERITGRVEELVGALMPAGLKRPPVRS